MDLEELDEVAGGKIEHFKYRYNGGKDTPTKQEVMKTHVTPAKMAMLIEQCWDDIIDGANFLVDGINSMFGLD